MGKKSFWSYDNLVVVGFLIVLLVIMIMMLFNLNKPKEFICLEDGRLIDASNTYTLRELFDECTYECKSQDYDCLKLCTDMVSNIVNYELNDAEDTKEGKK